MFARVYTCISIGTLWYSTQCLLKLNHNHCSWNQDIAWLLGQLLHIASLCCSVLLCWCLPICPNLGVWASRWLASSCQLAKQQIRHYYDSSTRSLCFMLWPSGRSTKHRPLTVSHSQQRCPSFAAQDYHDLLIVTVTQWTKDKLEFNSLPAGSRTLPWKFSLGLMLFISFIKDADFCVKPYQYQMGRTHTTSRPQRLCWHKVLVWLETGASAFCDQSKYVPFGTASTLAMLFKEETARLTFRHFVFGHLPRQLWGPTTLLGVLWIHWTCAHFAAATTAFDHQSNINSDLLTAVVCFVCQLSIHILWSHESLHTNMFHIGRLTKQSWSQTVKSWSSCLSTGVMNNSSVKYSRTCITHHTKMIRLSPGT